LTRATGVTTPDPWEWLRKWTPARIALGRAGGSLPTAQLLKFSLDHAAARDAVYSELDMSRLEQDLAGFTLHVMGVSTQVRDRRHYLERPDLGRLLDEPSLERLQLARSQSPHDVCLIVADGLSALAAQSHSPALLQNLIPVLQKASLLLAPLTIVRFGRVGVMDVIGAELNCRAAVILIGERPGLAACDSLGAYLVYEPGPGKTDADRNCVSNIHPAGLSPDAAAQTIFYLLSRMLDLGLSGVRLKDERTVQNRGILKSTDPIRRSPEPHA
jgi:ethanolamine ammonia-lyase small subunit